jgi:enoyl-CoA hydratase/carnithine racemase
MEEGLLETARSIASKSPVAINTLKHIFRREQYKKVYESIQYMARTNSSMLFTKDTMEAISAFLQKKQPVFPKL